ncbi:hypothetical protein NPA07_04545 [Mycoplasmopsis caviae]|uniref:Integral membrane protein (Intg_mem_TP0381) n=1 Tax=Mycoplasmopsis caviae TaxID=55603 RepID=A0A3P8KMS6_9BACT|nr:hypothetical protein [Mycoplasmopsis caviae]UUD35046.1 hypothetical protein NPA07_04545 [Mycoplasmopsis caviae]VDR42128.1 Uncharacterised protein [Mycoplasmopsis caviae]
MDFLSRYHFAMNTQFANGTPKSFGPFHLTFMFTFLILGIMLCVALWNKKEWAVKTTIGFLFFVMVLIEILKQMLWFGVPKEINPGVYKFTISYRNYVYPVVICSLPLYFLPFYLFIGKPSRIKDLVTDFCAFITIYGGSFIMLIHPEDAYVPTMFISIHTMIYHGCMLVIGMILIVNNFARFKNGAFIANSYFMYTIIWSIAIIANEIVYQVSKNTNWWAAYVPNFLLMSHRQHVSFVQRFDYIFKINSREIYWTVPFICLILNFIFGYITYGFWWSIEWISRFVEKKYKEKKHWKSQNDLA